MCLEPAKLSSQARWGVAAVTSAWRLREARQGPCCPPHLINMKTDSIRKRIYGEALSLCRLPALHRAPCTCRSGKPSPLHPPAQHTCIARKHSHAPIHAHCTGLDGSHPRLWALQAPMAPHVLLCLTWGGGSCSCGHLQPASHLPSNMYHLVTVQTALRLVSLAGAMDSLVQKAQQVATHLGRTATSCTSRLCKEHTHSGTPAYRPALVLNNHQLRTSPLSLDRFSRQLFPAGRSCLFPPQCTPPPPVRHLQRKQATHTSCLHPL